MNTLKTPNKAGNPRLRVLLTGKTGQVGGDLFSLLTDFTELLATDRASLDLTRPEKLRECVRAFVPDVIINAAAYTGVDKAESEAELAAAINSTAPTVLAEEASRNGALLIHYSTDYVFDGTKAAPYVESDPVNPLNVYGRTKAAGEDAIRASGCKHLILRTSWVYSPRGSNFMRTILRLAAEREELRIVDDQVGAPTSSRSIAQATVKLLRRHSAWGASNSSECGTYHLTASGQCSWFEFASEIIRQSNNRSLRVQRVLPIPTSSYPTPARRPQNSRLDCSKLDQVFGITMPCWRDELTVALAQTV